MNILITGASGFLGSALARHFDKTHHQVSLLVRKSANLYRISDLSNFKIGRCESDVEINQFIAQESPDIVLHTACCYGRNGESNLQLIDSNIRFGSVILQALCDGKKKVSFINAGTVLSRDVSFYALTKLEFEELASRITLGANKVLQFINVKLQHMYGPGDDITKFTSYVLDSCRKNIPTLPLTLGDQKRDFVYIDDVVDAYVKILDNLSKLDQCQVIELGSGVAPPLRDFVETSHRLTNSKTELLFGHVPYRENDAMSMVANIEVLKGLGWIPKYDLESGIKKIIEMDSMK